MLFSFANNVVETCSYALEIFRNIGIKHLFNSKGYFYVFDIFYEINLRAFNSVLKLKKPYLNQSAVYLFICKIVSLVVFIVNIDFNFFFGCVDANFVNCKQKIPFKDTACFKSNMTTNLSLRQKLTSSQLLFSTMPQRCEMLFSIYTTTNFIYKHQVKMFFSLFSDQYPRSTRFKLLYLNCI